VSRKSHHAASSCRVLLIRSPSFIIAVSLTLRSTLLRQISTYTLPKFPTWIKIMHVEQEVVASTASVLEVVLAADLERTMLLQEEQELTLKLKQEAGEDVPAANATTVEAGKEPPSPTSSTASGAPSVSSSATTVASASSSSSSSGTSTADRLTAVYDRLLELDSATAKARAGTILAGLQFSQEMIAMPTKALSGGWRSQLKRGRERERERERRVVSWKGYAHTALFFLFLLQCVSPWRVPSSSRPISSCWMSQRTTWTSLPCCGCSPTSRRTRRPCSSSATIVCSSMRLCQSQEKGEERIGRGGKRAARTLVDLVLPSFFSHSIVVVSRLAPTRFGSRTRSASSTIEETTRTFWCVPHTGCDVADFRGSVLAAFLTTFCLAYVLQRLREERYKTEKRAYEAQQLQRQHILD
jgi:hypothetical protein